MLILLKHIHELNQPLTVIKAYLGGCLIRLKRNELNCEQMISIVQKISEHAELFENKVYSMQQIITHEEYNDTPSAITEIISLFTFDLQHLGIKLTLDFHSTDFDFSIDNSLLKHILFRLLKQCITAVEVNKIQKAQLTVQTQFDNENALNMTIKSNFPIRETDLEHELMYCRSLLMSEKGELSIELLPNGMCFNFIIVHQKD